MTSPYDQIIVDIKDYVFHYQIESPNAWVSAQTTILDALGCAIEGIATSSGCRSLLGPVIPETITPDGFRLPGSSYQLDPVKGAFDMATMIRYLDRNDALGGKDWGHPSDNLGALIAVSDWLSRSSASGRLIHKGPRLTMRTLLEATVKAYEIQGCFLLNNAFNQYGLDHTVLVKLASTAVVSWLLGLSEDQTMAAISHVWMDGIPLRIFRTYPNSTLRKSWAAGDACMRAVQLALLTRSGQSGAPTVLTEPRWGFYATTWRGESFAPPRQYGTWVVENVFFKITAAEGHGISAMEAALQQTIRIQAQGLDPGHAIKKIKIRTNASANMIINRPGKLHGAADRDHCMQYMIAVTILKGAVPDAADFQDDSPWAADTRVTALMAKCEIMVDKDLTRDYLDITKRSVASGVTVLLHDESELGEVLIEFGVGHPRNEETLPAVRAKFKKNMALLFSEQEVKEISAAMTQDGPISSFIDLLSTSLNFRLRLRPGW
ncbi:putative 2-methylcitrate dehydratase [Leptodontidium sp. MPI-SDFR-AT-0119]|nr:putative 2-methylcitrate dehydratase [Leptodontidium sp. MPI-SDFR-AT-0119]